MEKQIDCFSFWYKLYYEPFVYEAQKHFLLIQVFYQNLKKHIRDFIVEMTNQHRERDTEHTKRNADYVLLSNVYIMYISI